MRGEKAVRKWGKGVGKTQDLKMERGIPGERLLEKLTNKIHMKKFRLWE